MYIAHRIKSNEYKKLNLDGTNDDDWNKAIEILQSRFNARYLEPVNMLIECDERRKPLDRRYGFSILAICCLLIETLQAFREGLTDTKGKSKEMFINFLTKRKYFMTHFNKNQAEEFYYKYRCGILHQAEVGGDSLLWSVGMVNGKKADGTPYINRTKIFELLKEEIVLYLEELKNKNNRELRNNFKTKMDFIARK